MIILIFPVIVALIVVAFVATVRAIQSWRGGNIQNRSVAYVMLGLAVTLDVLVVTFSISVCSYAARQGLEIRGDALRNAEVLRLMLGGSSEDQGMTVAGIWGFIIPLLSWVSAHGVVMGIVEPIRLLGAILVDRDIIRRQEGSALAVRAANRLRNRIVQFCGFALAGIAAFLVFRIVISFDKLLFQYQIIDSSLLRKLLGGRGWSVRYSPEQLTETLRGTFLGQMALHAGDFYVICLFVTAFLLVVAVHRAWHAGGNDYPIRQGNPTVDILTPGRPPTYPRITNDHPREVAQPENPPVAVGAPVNPPDQPDPPDVPQPPDTGIILDEPR